MRKRAVDVRGIRFELPSALAARVRAAASGSTLNEWARNALAAGFSVPPDELRADLPAARRGSISLFLELPPAFIERMDARAVHVNMRRTEYARACFARAVNRVTNPAVP